MIPDLLGMIFGTDVVEMSVRAAMGQQTEAGCGEGKAVYATHNLHSDRDGFFKGIAFSDDLRPHVVRECVYKKAGDDVQYFDNASKALGIVFMHFDSEEQMEWFLGHIHEHIHVLVEGKA